MLLEEFLKPMKITQRELADSIHVPYQRINEIINGRRGITPGTALRLMSCEESKLLPLAAPHRELLRIKHSTEKR